MLKFREGLVWELVFLCEIFVRVVNVKYILLDLRGVFIKLLNGRWIYLGDIYLLFEIYN